MIPVSVQTLATVLNGHPHINQNAIKAELAGCPQVKSETGLIDSITTDSRKVTAGCLFVALSGERFDGHDFVDQAQAAGAAAVLVSRPLAQCTIPQLVVEDSRKALGKLAGWLREQLSVTLVALTGSSGKTTVKEMTAAILRQCGETLATEGNLNNDIGVPLSLLRLTPHHRFAVIELGANHAGEIAWTVSMAQPHAVLVNNVSAAHLAGFGSLSGVAQAKGEIFTGLAADGIAIINANSHDIARWQSIIGQRQLWRFALHEQCVQAEYQAANPQDGRCDFYVSNLQQSAESSEFQLHSPQGMTTVRLPLPGVHNVLNALAASALALAAGAPLSAIQPGLASVRPLTGRLFPVTLGAGQRLLDDSYNANSASMQAAIAVLAAQPGFRVLVAGDMAELGDQAQACHRQVGESAHLAGLDAVLTVGELSAAISQYSGVGEHFTDKAALLARLRQLLAAHHQACVLVKGSRSSAMEQVVQALQEGRSC